MQALNLELNRGEIFGFLGLNGAGKSTTIRMILGLIRPTAGHVELFGHPLYSDRPRLLARVGAIVDSPAFFPYLSGEDNLAYFARLGRIARPRVGQLLARVGLSADQHRRYETYSPGMRQRLGIALALLRDPELLLLDEPTNGLDPVGQRTMRTLVADLAAEGRTIFMCSHLLHEVEQTCHRVGILQRGSLIAAGSVQDLLQGEQQIELQLRLVEQAEEVLRTVAWISRIERDGHRLILKTQVTHAEEVVALLAGRQIYPTVVRPREINLEELFLDLTHEAEAGTSSPEPPAVASARHVEEP